MLLLAAALLSGLLFGAGLGLSQMINPAKVLAFLDFGGIASGAWDPSLAFVMAGALAVTVAGYALARHRERPILTARFGKPSRSSVDRRLAAGAVLFGAGWGLVGFCPGPAIASASLGGEKSLLFLVAMLAGMAAYRVAFEDRP